MAFSIDPNIPLQAKERDYGRGFDNMQTYQANALKLQQLRDAYDVEKADRLRQKQMRSGIQTDIEQIQRGIPAKYSPLQYQQTPQTGQMPYGMTGVLASERGQNMPQPKLFGEDLMNGNYQLGGGEVTQEAVAGREPSYTEMLQIGFKNAMLAKDVESAFKYAAAIKQQQQADRELNAPIGNPYPVYDTQGNFVGTRIMTKTGQEVPFGQQGTTTVKPKTSLVKTSLGYEVVKEGELPKGKPIEQTTQPRQPRLQQVTDATGTYILDLDTGETRPVLIGGKPVSKPDPVQRASDIADVKADAKVRQDLVNDAANVTKNYQILNPIINNALTIVKKLPPDMLQSFVQSKLAGTPLNKYLGNKEQQQAITDYNVMLEHLRLFIEKPVGAISNYEQGILGRAIGILEGNYSVEQKESVLKQVKTIFDNQYAVAVKVLRQNKGDKFIFGNNQQNNAPLRFKKESTSQQRKEYAEAIIEARGDSEKIKEIQEYARDIGVLE